MKSLIKKLLRESLSEAEYNYHYGNVDTDKEIRPHGSDSIHGMSGRGTGHFGSGLYFSTYTCNEKTDADEKHGEYSNSLKTPEFIQVDKGLYRVDTGLYNNLYRITSNTHGDILFKTLKSINDLYYWSKEDLVNGKIRNGFSDNYITIKHNFKQLKLDIPQYKEFITLFKKATEDDGNRASMSTRIMEYLGYNGVNASNIPDYDNTTHGSVIYDINKVGGDMKKVQSPEMFCDIKKDVAGQSLDIKTKILRGDSITIYWDKFNKLPKNEKLMLMKRYYHYESNTEAMDTDTERYYYLTLPIKMRSGKMKGKFSEYMIEGMLDWGLHRYFYEKDIMVDGRTLLEFTLLHGWRLPDDVKKGLVKGINRELSPTEQEELEGFL